MKNLRPVSLCNVLFEILAKVLANRLKTILPKVISEFQSVFVPDRANTDNILMAFKIIHAMKRKLKGKVGGCFLHHVMAILGFD